MKEFLEDLEQLLIKHPNAAIFSKPYKRGVFIRAIFGDDLDDMISVDHELTLEDIQRFKRELEANDA